MTDPVTLATAGVATALSLAIGWMAWPRSPELDGERLFKTVLATLLRGRVEAVDGDSDAWMAAVVANAPYHPAGRFPEVKVTQKGLLDLPAYIEGEQALVEKLAALPDLEARWRFLYSEDEAGLAARLDDPILLGSEYDPATWLGPQQSWQSIADWGAGETTAMPDALARKSAAVWVLVDGRHDEPVLDALEALVPNTIRVPWTAFSTDALEDTLAAAMDDPHARFVLVGAEAGIQIVLHLLNGRAPLRDQTVAVLSIGGLLVGQADVDGPLGGAAVRGWMDDHFTHHELDTEMTRRTPYFCLQWLDPATDPPAGRGQTLGHGRFPDPRLDAMTQEYVEVVDLGVLYEDAEPPLVAQGLWTTVSAWVLSAAG